MMMKESTTHMIIIGILVLCIILLGYHAYKLSQMPKKSKPLLKDQSELNLLQYTTAMPTDAPIPLKEYYYGPEEAINAMIP